MDNRQVSWTLRQIAHYLEISGANSFKVSAYRRAARTVEDLEQPLPAYKPLESLPGIGKGTASIIREYLDTGQVQYLNELKEKHPLHIDELLRVPGIGPKMAKRLHEQLGIQNVEQLEEAAEAGQLQGLAGIGPKMEHNILQATKNLKERPQRFPLATVLPVVRHIETVLANMEGVEQFSAAGSYRRGRDTLKDVDFVLSTLAAEKVVDQLVEMPGTARVVNKGLTKVTLEMQSEWQIAVDFRLVPPQAYATAVHHFTGSAEHHVQLRRLAKAQGKKISEYTIETAEGATKEKEERKSEIAKQSKAEASEDFEAHMRTGKQRKQVKFRNEKDIYRSLQLDYIPPEIREGSKEIELAQKGELPQLIQAGDIRADLHMHSTWSDGRQTILEMAKAARDKGYEYMAVTDHSVSLRIAGGLSVDQLRRQREEIEKVNEQFTDFTVLAGVEMDILPDGRLDYPDQVLEELDVVIASVHSAFKQDEQKMTGRIIRAIEHPLVDIIAHPTGRIIGRRDAYALNMEKVMEAAAEHEKVLELNANPNRLDLQASYLKKAKEEYGIRLSINTDAHHVREMAHMEIGLKTARRGWLEAEDVINTMSLRELQDFLQRR